ncbi:MAG: hypothetical protein LC620_05515, partial [Halobacteriales archaeon]|nr:hypothetical protein [Halobacteriales archaeon]
MRALLAAAALAALVTLTLAPAEAQLPAPTYVFSQVIGPAAAQAPGSMPSFNFTVERTCTMAADVLPAAKAKVQFASDADLSVAGPGEILFPQQVCAWAATVAVRFEATVAVPADAGEHVHKITAHLQADSPGPLPRGGGDASTDFLLSVKPAPVQSGVMPIQSAKS